MNSVFMLFIFLSTSSIVFSYTNETSNFATVFEDDAATNLYDEEPNPQPIIYAKRDYTVINFEIYIKEASCNNRPTTSKFSIFVGSLNKKSTLVDFVEVKSHDFYYDDQDKSWYCMTNVPAGHLKDCLRKGGESCFPRADVIYIHYSGSGKDRWAIEYIEVTTFLAFGPRDKDHNKIDFLHNIMFGCDLNLIYDIGYYQIGPRHGLILYLGKDKLPEIGTWVRDWV